MILSLLLACSQDGTITAVDRVLAVSPGVVDLGDVPVGDTAGGEITLAWVQGDEIRVLALDVLDIAGDAFSVDTTALPTVPRDGFALVPVRYAPGASGWHRAQLSITTDEDEDNVHVVELRGHAATPTLAAWPLVLDFGAVAAGTVAEAELTLANPGSLPLPLGALTASDARFAAATTTTVLDPGATLGVPVTFAPDGDAPVNATLTVSAAGTTDLAIALRGNDCEAGAPAAYDADADGYTTCGGDCDDADPAVHPGAIELPDGVDQDCDGAPDEGTTRGDDDGDGYTEDEGDCNDARAEVHPEQAENLANGIDDDCDGIVDLGTTDADGDGWSPYGGDCDDADDTVWPGAPETADGDDDDCDGTADEGTTAYDDDGDGVSEEGGDCDDTDPAIAPGAVEAADGRDDDCDGVVDDGTDRGDDDGDGFTEVGGDCDDSDAGVSPADAEVDGDGVDNDCDGEAR